jgi:hypothetical protein
MKHSKYIGVLMLLTVALVWGSEPRPESRASSKRQAVVERCDEAQDVVIRFYYNPAINEPDLSPGPLIVLPVSSQDPQVGTKSGWILRIALSDLHRLLGVLARSSLGWNESDAPRQLVVDLFGLPQSHHQSMEVAVSCPAGSATAEVEAKRVCPLLSEVYKSLTDPKARDSMTFWTGSVTCVVKAQRSSSPIP